MSETAETNRTSQKRRITFFIAIAVVVFLVLVYVGGIFILPASIQASHQNKKCGSTLTLNSIYTSIYPSFMADKSLAGPVMECAVFTLASLNEEKKAWLDSYDAFNVYSETYPNGLFIAEAHEDSAVVLTGLAREQLSEKKYAEAMGSLNLVLSK